MNAWGFTKQNDNQMENSTLRVAQLETFESDNTDINLYPDIFSQHSAAAYDDVINQAKNLVLQFLHRQKKTF